MPDDVAQEKVKALISLGAEVELVRPASIVDKKQVRYHPLLDSILLIFFIVSDVDVVCGTVCTPRCTVNSPRLSQNLARARAEHFGQAASSRPHVMRTSTSSVVVTTSAPEDLLDEHHGALTIEEEEELRTKPRGFFADQFEVGPHAILLSYQIIHSEIPE